MINICLNTRKGKDGTKNRAPRGENQKAAAAWAGLSSMEIGFKVSPRLSSKSH